MSAYSAIDQTGARFLLAHVVEITVIDCSVHVVFESGRCRQMGPFETSAIAQRIADGLAVRSGT